MITPTLTQATALGGPDMNFEFNEAIIMVTGIGTMKCGFVSVEGKSVLERLVYSPPGTGDRSFVVMDFGSLYLRA